MEFKKTRSIILGIAFSLFITSLQAQVTFQSSGAIDLPDGAAAPIESNPYPSQITVDGLSGLIKHLTVTLHGFTHSFPDAADIILVAPDGTNVTILSDVGGAVDISDLTITLDDSAAAYLPDGSTFSSGTYKPTNMGAVIDSWPGVNASGNSTLSTFNGLGPNGTWRLYAVNDVEGSEGSIAGGWSLNFETQTGGVLPVSLTGFNANYNKVAQSVQLDWTTTVDNSPADYIIESSNNGLSWKQIGRVSSAATAVKDHYFFTDKRPLDGNIYYRLKLIRSDNQYVYSKVLVVTVSDDVQVSVYPNPVSSFLYIDQRDPTQKITSFQLMDSNGRSITDKMNVTNGAPYRFDVGGLKSGVYFIKVFSGNRETVKRILISG